ncbi:VOC family protein [Maritalea mediterranea]|uniref:VOC family protein n=1 Tax=Maritalea mediterranea TaxID=2909667 RepID=A0ABS9EAE5_9HYPH|nr:VOC family protein [Maritalea mediterranea]MCF4099733.1 VOC family protein [Maritalea mediterranea]
MRKFAFSILFGLALTASGSAQGFGEATVALPVTSLDEAKAWYGDFLGPDAEMIEPAPGVVELRATPHMWLQLYETEQMPETGAVIRFLVEDMDAAQAKFAEKGIDVGEAIEVPGIVIYSEFTDPFGNGMGLYDLP